MSDDRQPGGKHFEWFVAQIEAAGGRYFNGEDWFCPAHDDGNRGSLGIRELDNGSVVMCCQGGCSNKDIFRAAGMQYPADFYPRNKRERYVYTDENGEKLYCVDRYYKDGKKQMAHRVYSPEHEKADKAGFASYPGCMRGVRRVLYRLPLVLKAIEAGKAVYLCAGEKDAKAMRAAYKVAATTASSGEGSKWNPELTEQLKGVKRLYVVADRDKVGYKRAAHVYDTLTAEGIDVRILLPHVTVNKGDAADHIADGHGLRDFERTEREDLPVEPDLIDLELSDTGNAERLEALYGGKIRYINHHKMWVVWDGRRWAEDEPRVIRLATATMRKMRKQVEAELEKEENENRIKALIIKKQFAVNSNNFGRTQSMLKHAAALEGISTYPADYDADPWLLNVANGTIDLRTGTFRPHERSQMLRKLSPVEFDPEAQAPTWVAFTRRIMPDREIRRLLRALCGYCLTGDTSESILPVFYGKGSNGKSTFTKVLSRLLGDYSKGLPQRTLLEKNGESIPNDIAMLEGARLSLASEFKEGARVDEALIKSITGGDEITARFLGKEYFKFYVQTKIILSTNHKPEIRGADDGIWRRMVLVPFTETIPDEEKDLELADKLWEERSGILNWCLAGLAEHRKVGLRSLMPESVAEANREYREESDLIGQFLEECCELGLEEEFWEPSSALYDAFREWMEESGQKPWTKITFGRAFAGRPGIESERRYIGKKQHRGFHGVKIVDAMNSGA